METTDKGRSLSEDELLTEKPVAPPRTKKKLRILEQQRCVGQSRSAPVSPVPSTPKRPPAPRPRFRPSNSTASDTAPLKDQLKPRHSKLEKSLSVPFRPAPPDPSRLSTTDSSAVKRTPERPKTPNPKLASPPQSVPPRCKSSLSTVSASSLPQVQKGHSRSESETITASVYNTRSKDTKTTTRSRSEDKSNNSVGPTESHYLNVAPRPPTSKKLSANGASLSKAYSHNPKVSKPRSSSVASSGVSSSQSAHNLYQPSVSSPRRPQNPPSRQRNKQKVKPQRPAPPPPAKVAHYSGYTEIGPAGGVAQGTDIDSDNYSYVSLKPRFTAGVSRQLQGLDLQVMSQQNPQSDSEIYVNDDYNGEVLRRVGSVDESIYMSLTSSTILDEDVYMAPQVDTAKPRQHKTNKQLSDLKSKSVDHTYLVPDDARLPSNHQVTEEHYMALSSSTIEEDSIYHSLVDSLRT